MSVYRLRDSVEHVSINLRDREGEDRHLEPRNNRKLKMKTQGQKPKHYSINCIISDNISLAITCGPYSCNVLPVSGKEDVDSNSCCCQTRRKYIGILCCDEEKGT